MNALPKFRQPSRYSFHFPAIILLALGSLAFGQSPGPVEATTATLINSLGSWSPVINDKYNTVVSGEGVVIASFGSSVSNRILRSLDGANWTTVAQLNDAETICSAYGGGAFVLGGASGHLLVSRADATHLLGEVWAPRTAGSDDFTDIIYADGKFRALASKTNHWGSFVDHAHIWTSSDGLTWVDEGATARPANHLVFGNGRYVALNDSSSTWVVQSSSDGRTWEEVRLWNTYSVDRPQVMFGNGQFLGLRSDGMLVTSTDGLNWFTTGGDNFRGETSQITLKYLDHLFVATVGNNTVQLLTSTNGVKWMPHAPSPSQLNWYGHGRVVNFFQLPSGGLLLQFQSGNTTRSLPSTTNFPVVARLYDTTELIAQNSTLTVAYAIPGQQVQWFQGETGDTSHPFEGATAETFITPSVPGAYRVWARVTNANGSTDSNAVSLAVQRPRIAGSSAVVLGQASSLRAYDVGSATLQWLRDGVAIPGATMATLELIGRPEEGAFYQLVCTGSVDSYTTERFPVIVWNGISGPSLLPWGKRLTMSGEASGRALSFQWYNPDGSPMGDDDRVSGSHTSSVSIDRASFAHSGTFWLDVLSDGLHVTSAGQTVEIVGVPSDFWVEGMEDWQVGKPVVGGIWAGGHPSMSITGLPQGLRAVNGSITGIPTAAGRYTLRITARNPLGSATLTRVVNVAPISPTLRGTFVALLNPLYDYQTGLWDECFVTVTVASNAGLSGSVLLRNRRYPFVAQWKHNIDTGLVTAHATLSKIAETSDPDLNLDLVFDGGTIQAEVWKQAFKIVGWPGSSGPLTQVASAADVAAKGSSGQYTVAFPMDTYTPVDPALPQGTGFCTGSISPSGNVTLVARLADDSVSTHTDRLGRDGSLPLYWSLYGGKGSAIGVLSLDTGNLDGSLIWIKPALPASNPSRHYRAGFTLPLTVVGGKFGPPTSGQLLLGATPGLDNASVHFERGTLPSVSQDFTMAANNLAQLPKGAPVTLKLNAAKGTFEGVLRQDGLSAPYYGIFVPRLGKGLGNFQQPLSAAPGPWPILSGAVTILVQ